jgi:hypothetical protein
VAVVQYTYTHKQYIGQYNSLIRESADRALSLCELYPGIYLTTEENHGKTSVRVAGILQFFFKQTKK